MTVKTKHGLRSREWFDIPGDPSSSAIHLERYTNYGISAAELRSGKPIIGIAQTGSDLVPCNRIHMNLVHRVRDGIREKGGIPMEFPVHPIQETGKRPTAALDRNLQYLGLVEVLFGYPIDGVVLTIGCDKTTPALLMAAMRCNRPGCVVRLMSTSVRLSPAAAAIALAASAASSARACKKDAAEFRERARSIETAAFPSAWLTGRLPPPRNPAESQSVGGIRASEPYTLLLCPWPSVSI